MGEVLVNTREGVHYRVEQGPMPFTPLWALSGTDNLPVSLSNLDPSSLLKDETMVLDLMRRDPSAISQAQYLAGRSLLTIPQGNIPEVAGEAYDALSISGYAFNRLVSAGNNAMVTQDVLLPRSDQNYREIRPNATSTTILSQGRKQSVSQPFLFPGAYTYEEMVNKVGNELGMWELLNERFGNDIPFLIPVPVMIGSYPELRDPQGRPAYFYATRNPYRGNRNGIFLPDSTMEDMQDRVEDSIFAATGARVLHDEFGLSHNQLVMGNYYAHPCCKMFMADFATLTPLDTTPIKASGKHGQPNHLFSRAFELTHMLSGSLTRIELPVKDRLGYMVTFIKSLLEIYLGVDANDLGKALAGFQFDFNNPDVSIAYALKRCQQNGIYNPASDIEQRSQHSMQVISKWKSQIAQALSV